MQYSDEKKTAKLQLGPHGVTLLLYFPIFKRTSDSNPIKVAMNSNDFTINCF